jgi:hypothetical protein
MFRSGDTFRCERPPRHIWVVLTDPAANGGRFLLVNMTSLRDSCIDDACVLQPSDYELLTHATTIAYSRALIANEKGLGDLVASGNFLRIPSVPAATLVKMIAGARTSRQLAPDKLKLLPLDEKRRCGGADHGGGC